MNKTLHKSNLFILTEKRRNKSNSKNLKIYYELELVGWSTMSFDDKVRDIVDPLRCKSGKFGCSWKFRNRKEAEKILNFLILRFS